MRKWHIVTTIVVTRLFYLAALAVLAYLVVKAIVRMFS